STSSTVSAPAKNLFRGSITHPTQLLCTLSGRRYRRLTQHSLPSGPLRPYSDRSCTRWTAPAKLRPSELPVSLVRQESVVRLVRRQDWSGHNRSRRWKRYLQISQTDRCSAHQHRPCLARRYWIL